MVPSTTLRRGSTHSADRFRAGIKKPGTRAANALVETVDIFPTLVELAGLPAPQVPQRIEGKSFVSALREPSLITKDFVYHAYPRGERIGRAIRTARYRLVEWKVPGFSPKSAGSNSRT